MTTYAHNITEGTGNPPPPPPPPDSRARMLAATERAARQANRIFDALCADDAATLDMTMRAWDVAAAALTRHNRLARRLRTRRTWAGVREVGA